MKSWTASDNGKLKRLKVLFSGLKKNIVFLLVRKWNG